MSPSPDHAADLTHPYSNVGYLYQQPRTRPKALEHLQSRGRNISRYELGRKDRYGERVTRIYPRELTKSPPARYPAGSPTAQPPYNATTSPLLSALGTTTNAAAQYTSEWTKSLPFFANQPSPSNGISIGGSPPNFHQSPAGQGVMSSSPPAAGMRPLSHPNHYPSFGGRLQNSPKQSPGRDRRASMYSQYGPRPPFQNNPPLPHQPQAHYYNLPDFDLGLTPPPSDGTTPGEHGYFCGLDTICMGGDDASQVAENVLLVGYEGGIEVFRVEKGRMDLVGRLEGLKGSVIGAKILPWASRRDPLASSRPLIALLIHGPAVSEGTDDANESGSNSVAVTDENDGSSNSPSRPASSSGNAPVNPISSYRTTLEVYSLKERKRLSTLYTSPPVPITDPIDSPMFQPPSPIGDFVVDACGKFVVLASGASGEVFIFAPYTKANTEAIGSFRCIGKVWTSVQFRDRGSHSSSSSATDVNGHEDHATEQYGVPLFSLSDRWLAISPPASTTLLPIEGVASTSKSFERPPGLAHHSVPPQPSPTCAVDAPEADGLLNRLTREGTQVALKGARWATEKGIQAFKNYMGKPAQPNGTVNGGNYGADPYQQPYFPPTHGHNQAQPRLESTVISILDLQKLFEAEESKNKSALHPVATLPAALGCSFLSFSPSGLMLMTVSKKGDFQDVWDLKRINYRKARKSSREISSGPHVRQVARFARMTVTNVIDVVWSAPRANRVAVITDKGTVHMFLMPASAFQWPPSRRTRKPDGTTKPKPDENTDSTTARTGAVNSAMQALNGTAKPFLNAVRSRSGSNAGSRFPSFSSLGMAPAAGAKSGKAVAAGLGKSIGAATSNIRHAGDNKLTLPPSQSGVKPGSVRWLTGKGCGSIALVAGGVLQIYKIQMRPATGKGKSKNATSISKRKIVEFGLTPVRGSVFAPAVIALLQPDEDRPQDLEHNRDMEIHGEWIPRSLPSRRGRGGVGGGKKVPAPAPLSLAEIETNPPYQPFYTDRRVVRFVFAKPAPQGEQHHSYNEWDAPPMSPLLSSQNLHHIDDGSAWVFGDDVDAVRISMPAQQLHDIGEGEGGDGDEGAVAAAVQNKLVLRDGEEEVEQVVVTTRRRRVRRGEGEEGEEGFFEDDCEVLDFAEDRV